LTAARQARPPRHTRPARLAAGTLHDHVHAQLEDLTGVLGLGTAGELLGRCHDVLLADSCGHPARGRPHRRSTLNIDGTPVQLSLSLRSDGSGLQFLGEAGAAELSNAERLATSRDRLRRVAILLGAEPSLAGIESLVDTLVPSAVRELLADHAGAVWLGAGCAPSAAPHVKLYCNAKWGDASSRWQRLRRVATSFGIGSDWPNLRTLENFGLEPLGTALRVASGSAAAARIYLSGYGLSWKHIEEIGARFADAAFDEQVSQLAMTLPGDGYQWPTRSVVCSFAVTPGRLTDVKVELCAHCAFNNDAEARARCLRWLDDDDVAALVYSRTLEILAPDGMNHAVVALHSHFGVDSRGVRTIYFNPRPAPGADDDH
jgi:hypothetical protein